MFTQTSWIIQDIFVVTVHWDLIRYVSMQFLMKCCWIMVETRVTCQFLTLVWPKKFLRILARSCAFFWLSCAVSWPSCAFLRGHFWGHFEVFRILREKVKKCDYISPIGDLETTCQSKKVYKPSPLYLLGSIPVHCPFLQSWCWSCPTFLFFHSIPDPRFLRCWYPTQHGQLESQFTLIWHGSLKKLRHLKKWHLNHLWKSIGKDFWQLHEFTLR